MTCFGGEVFWSLRTTRERVLVSLTCFWWVLGTGDRRTGLVQRNFETSSVLQCKAFSDQGGTLWSFVSWAPTHAKTIAMYSVVSGPTQLSCGSWSTSFQSHQMWTHGQAMGFVSLGVCAVERQKGWAGLKWMRGLWDGPWELRKNNSKTDACQATSETKGKDSFYFNFLLKYSIQKIQSSFQVSWSSTFSSDA